MMRHDADTEVLTAEALRRRNYQDKYDYIEERMQVLNDHYYSDNHRHDPSEEAEYAMLQIKKMEL